MTPTTEPKSWHDAVKHEYMPGYTRDTVVIPASASDNPLNRCTLLGKVTASGEFVPHNPAASDGSEVAAGILYTHAVDASTAAQSVVALVRGPALIAWAGLELVNPLDATQTATAQADLLAVGIKTLETA